jgi:hypothetical protein
MATNNYGIELIEDEQIIPQIHFWEAPNGIISGQNSATR